MPSVLGTRLSVQRWSCSTNPTCTKDPRSTSQRSDEEREWEPPPPHVITMTRGICGWVSLAQHGRGGESHQDKRVMMTGAKTNEARRWHNVMTH